ncbi:MAG: Gfo/Idh/MocA family oxidoreductase [Melioribacteraceae bacterium]|nr:Gfo/Idh/MocA family oxidoreductase [Melioribacteraceae bacterium]
MKIGIIGLGYWGPNLVRNFLGNENVNEVYGFDIKEPRTKFIKTRFPEVKITDTFEDLLRKNCDAYAIATPIDTHYAIAKRALENGGHIWVEKPYTSTSIQAQELNELAEKKNLKVFIDHTFIYTGAVKKIKELVEQDVLGEVIYFDSVRINLGLFQNDVNVIWDLAPHDLSIMDYVITDKKISAVCANGIANYYNHENIAYISIYFENNCFGHFHVNWTSPVKIRRTIIGGKKKMLVFDDMENIEKIKIYDSGIELNNKEKIHEALIQYRIGDMYSPKVTQTEALTLGVQEFICSIQNNKKPLTDGNDGLKIVKILEAAEKSIKEKGKLIYIQ